MEDFLADAVSMAKAVSMPDGVSGFLWLSPFQCLRRFWFLVSGFMG